MEQESRQPASLEEGVISHFCGNEIACSGKNKNVLWASVPICRPTWQKGRYVGKSATRIGYFYEYGVHGYIEGDGPKEEGSDDRLAIEIMEKLRYRMVHKLRRWPSKGILPREFRICCLPVIIISIVG
jgi:hypothetical protein